MRNRDVRELLTQDAIKSKNETRIGCCDTDKKDDCHEMGLCAFLPYTEAVNNSRLVRVFSRCATKVSLGLPIHPDLTSTGAASYKTNFWWPAAIWESQPCRDCDGEEALVSISDPMSASISCFC